MTHLSEEELSAALKEMAPPPAIVPDRAARARSRARVLRRRRFAVAGTAVAAVVGLAATAVAIGTSGGPGTSAHVATGPSIGPAGTACHAASCDPATVLAAIRRPLQLPTMPANGRCPVSPRHTFHEGTGFSGPVDTIGTGPLLLSGYGSGIPARPDDAHPQNGWLDAKVIWLFDKSYAGPLLLRGGRIDDTGQLGFDRYIGADGYQGGAGDGPVDQLLYVRGGLGATPLPGEGNGSAPSGIYVHAPGCYAIQVDGDGVSGMVVFRVVAS